MPAEPAALRGRRGWRADDPGRAGGGGPADRPLPRDHGDARARSSTARGRWSAPGTRSSPTTRAATASPIRAPPGEGVMYTRSSSPTSRRSSQTQVGEGRFALAGHSMGAHTAVAYALAHPERVAALVVIGPVYDGTISAESLEYWDGLAAALEERRRRRLRRLHRPRPGDRSRLARLGDTLHPRAHAAPPPPRRRRRGAAPGAALAALRLARRARAARGPGAGRRQRRRRRSRASLRDGGGVRAPAAARGAGQRGRGAVAAGLAGGTALARDRRFCAANWPKAQE